MLIKEVITELLRKEAGGYPGEASEAGNAEAEKGERKTEW